MNLRRHILNLGLRLIEKPYLARARDPVALRQGIEAKARFWLRSPLNTVVSRDAFGPTRVPVTWTYVGDPQDPPILLHFHGGGYVFGSAETHRAMLARLAELAGGRAVLPDYRLAPEHPFPAALDDARTVYRALLAAGYRADRIVLGGDSAGGGLALSLLADILANKLPRPAAVYAMSPLTDLTFSGGSIRFNARKDVLLPAERAIDTAQMYLQGHDPRDPAASPLWAEFRGAPDIFLAASNREILLDDTTRLVERLKSVEVGVTKRIADDLPHVWPLFWRHLPEGDDTLSELATWITSRMPPSA